jgi:membrane protein
VTSLGVFGVVWLLAALVILMSTVEQAFNETWQVAQTRSWRRKLSDYLSIFLIFPIFMAVAISLSGGIMSQPDIRAFLVGILPEFLYSATSGLLSLGLLWVAFTFFYQVMPNTKVHFLSALLGGILGGSLWQMAHYLFAWFQGAATYYNAIYGALYHLLFLVIWMFWSWLIVLLGTEVVFAHQNLEELSRECRRPAPAPEPVDEYLAFAGLIAICQPYVRREALLTLADLQRLLVTADTLAARTLQALLECGLVLEVAEAAAPDLHRLVPALPPDQVTVKETLDCLRQKRYAALTQTLAPDPRLENLWQHLLQRLSPSPWDVMTLTELIKALDQEDWPEAIERQAIERQAIGNKQ